MSALRAIRPLAALGAAVLLLMGGATVANAEEPAEDTTPPVITWVVPETEGAKYYYGSVPIFSCTAYDAVDGEVPCDVGLHFVNVGHHSATAYATDTSGNTATSERTFEVLPWTLSGFSQPVRMGEQVYNTVKGGATVPLKFEVFAGETAVTGAWAVASVVVTSVSCTDPTVEYGNVAFTSTGGTAGRSDGTAGRFIRNWQTPTEPGTCYRVTVTTQDFSQLSALFALK